MKNFVLALLFIISCSLMVPQKNIKPKWPQLLLTNSYHFNYREAVSGASAFLIDTGKDTLACTAKHLLGDAMGVEPVVKTKDFNKLLDYWFLYQRTMELKGSKIRVVSIVNKEENADDILLMRVKIPSSNMVKPLKVFKGKLAIGDSLFVAGCEYKESSCRQNIYAAIYQGVDDAFLSVKINKVLDGSGFSGAPIFNKQMQVVGVIYGGHAEKESFVFVATSMEKVSKYIR